MKFVEVIGKFVCAVAVGCGGWLRFHKFVKVDVKATQAIGNVNLGAKMKVVPSSTIAVELMIAMSALLPGAPAVGILLASLPRDTPR